MQISHFLNNRKQFETRLEHSLKAIFSNPHPFRADNTLIELKGSISHIYYQKDGNMIVLTVMIGDNECDCLASYHFVATYDSFYLYNDEGNLLKVSAVNGDVICPIIDNRPCLEGELNLNNIF